MGFVDIPFQALIGEEKLKVARPQAHCLNCGLPKARRKYVSFVKKQFAIHRIQERLFHIQGTRQQDRLTPQQEEAMTKIDQQRAEIMKAADKRCRKLCMGEVDFSPTMVKLSQRLGLYKLILLKKQQEFGVLLPGFSRLRKVNTARIR